MVGLPALGAPAHFGGRSGGGADHPSVLLNLRTRRVQLLCNAMPKDQLVGRYCIANIGNEISVINAITQENAAQMGSVTPVTPKIQ